MLRFLSLTIAVLAFVAPVLAEPLGLGRAALPVELRAWNTDVRPDGLGLPEGSGNVLDGEAIFAKKCAACHGDFAEGVDRWPALAGGQGSLQDARPLKTLGSYWPYLSTSWDYIYRAMPFDAPASLEARETYAIVAYLLFANDLVDDDSFVLSRENLPNIALPNAETFRDDDRAKTEYKAFRGACMDDCKPSVTITKRATGVGVTPDEADN
jgi:mono/diheme cytochrome c family protein